MVKGHKENDTRTLMSLTCSMAIVGRPIICILGNNWFVLVSTTLTSIVVVDDDDDGGDGGDGGGGQERQLMVNKAVRSTNKRRAGDVEARLHH